MEIIILTIILIICNFVIFYIFKKTDIELTTMEQNSESTNNIQSNINETSFNEEEKTNQTYIGDNNSDEPIFVDNDGKHYFICGTTGSGKTVALSNFINGGIESEYPMLLIDGKGDTSDGSLFDIMNFFNQLKYNEQFKDELSEDEKEKLRHTYIINLNDPHNSCKYNPFKNTNTTVIKDMLINMTNWSEEHYKLNTERYLQKLLNLLVLNDIKLNFKTIVENMNIKDFVSLSLKASKNESITKEEHIKNIEFTKSCESFIDGTVARFSTILESEIGTIFDEDGIDIYTALSENANILFVLNPLLYPEISPLFGNLVIIDSKKAVSNLFENEQRIFYIMDEINVYASKSLVDLVNKSRSANITCILATQSLSDLEFDGSSKIKEQIIENCNNYFILRQNNYKNAEEWANIVGTDNTIDITYQIDKDSATGLGSAKRTREYIFHPDKIKNLSTGRGFYVSKDKNVKTSVKFYKSF